MRFGRKVSTAVLAMGIVAVSTTWADACPNCKDALHGDYQAIAYGVSILLMMAMPFSLLAVWIWVIARGLSSDHAVANAQPTTDASVFVSECG